MPLATGTRIGVYEVISLIGAGGMGEVYRARDNLKRDVALKTLPDGFTREPERLARFQREAEILAALNHPGIAGVYGYVENAGVRAIAMEYVDGPALSAPLPVETVLDYARQIAEALEYAHERGIVHRDLKPANIKLTAEGKIKLLDFGLAKAVEDPLPASNPAESPTLTLGYTRAGVILGTAAYMAPEQVVGQTADRRADIFSFGAVLYEMLTGHRAFSGASVGETLAAVVKDEPDWSRLPAGSPVALLKRCLSKERKQRLQAIGEFRIALDNPTPAVPAPALVRSSTAPWAVAAAFVAMAPLGYVAFQHSREEPPRVIRFSISPPENGALAFNGPTISVSPDGRKIVFAATVEGDRNLWLRDLDASTARMLPGTEGGNTSFWAPDSRRLAFNAGGKLKTIDVAGGPPITLADSLNTIGSWSSSDEILFTASATRAVSRIAASGGMPVPVTRIDQKAPAIVHINPWLLPGGRDFLFAKATNEAGSGVYVGALDAPNDPENSPLLAGVSSVVYAPPGYLLFVRERTLMAQPFDAGQRILAGEAVPLVEQVYGSGSSAAFGYFAASQNGVLAYATNRDTARIQLTWFDRGGKNLGIVGPVSDLEAYTLAPDGNSVVVARRDTQGERFDLWRHDLVRGGQSRLTFAGNNRYPVFSADGSRVFFTRERDGEGEAKTLSVAANGSGQPEAVDDTRRLLTSDASRDGRYLFSNTGVIDRKQLNDLWVQPLFGDRKSFPYLATEFNEAGARISPDGRWLAYQSNESKRDEVYVISFPMLGGKWQISTGGGSDPMWSQDGRELYFYSAGREIMAVDIRAGEQFSAGIPRPLFKVNLATANNRFNVGKDGRFLLPVLLEQAASTPIEVIVNWPELLKR